MLLYGRNQHNIVKDILEKIKIKDLNRHFSEDKLIHENMLNIREINQSGKCKSKAQCDITSYLLEWLLSTGQEITSVEEDVEKRKSLYILGVNVNRYSHYGKQ